MDRLESLGNTLSQMTVYDIKSMYNQAKNMVMNVSEMEAKVREATNDEPWGASSTLMQEIAQGTFNFQQFNEIMPCIYSRFMDKEARQWREIYKALQLLEYIIKHGSERVVDDARSHLSTIKMLRNFHYIDEKGKDQGINVRNRAKELSELLMDVDRIRTERRKAKANRNKYTGTGNDGMSFAGAGGRYGGFGNSSLGNSSRSYGGGYDRDYGGSSSGFHDETSNRRGFDEYDAGGDEISVTRRSNSVASGSGATSTPTVAPRAPTTSKSVPEPAKPTATVDDLIAFGDNEWVTSPTTSAPLREEKALPTVGANPLVDDDDEFDDFKAAPPSATFPSAPLSAPIAPTTSAASNIFDALGSAPPTTVGFNQRPAQAVQSSFPVLTASTGTGMGNPAYAGASLPSSRGFGGGAIPPTSPPASSAVFRTATAPIGPVSAISPRPAGAPVAPSSVSGTNTGPRKTSSTPGGFDDLWSMSLGSASASKGTSSSPAGGMKSIKDLEKEKAAAGIWGGASSGGASAAFGGFGNAGTGSGGAAASGSGGMDDLLL